MSSEPKSKIDEALNNYQQQQPQADENAEMRQFMAEQKAKDKHDKDRAEYNAEMSRIVSHCREDVDIPQSDLVIRGTINAIAEENPNFQDAYINRNEKPEAYKEVLDFAKAKVKEELVNSASAAKVVQAQMGAIGHSEEEPSKPRNGKTDEEVLSMTTQEFEQYKAANR